MQTAPGAPGRPLTQQLYWFGALGVVSYGMRTVLSHVLPFRQLGFIYGVLLLLATAGPLMLLAKRRGPLRFGSSDARIALAFALAFGLLSLPAVPVGTDLWYYIAEGRLAASGANVYVDRLTPEIKAGLPMDPDRLNITMPYGPVWVWISTGLSSVAGRRVGVEFALYKTLVFVAWAATLWLIYNALKQTPERQTQAVLVAGWLPFAVVMSVAEAHNDILMTALLTGWLVSGPAAGSWMLVASALVKFVTVPVTGLAAIDAIVRRSPRAFVSLAVAGLVAAIVLAIYWSDGGLIGAMSAIAMQRHLTPSALLAGAAGKAQLPAWMAGGLILGWRLLLVGLVLWYGWRHVRRPSRTSLCAWSGALLLAIVLGADRLWPWYALWMLPAVVLSGDVLLMTVALPLIVLLPIVQVLYMWQYLTVTQATALLYAALGAIWLVTMRRALRPF